MRIHIESLDQPLNTIKKGVLDLVDLGGLEAVGKTNEKGDRADEGNNINLALGKLAQIIQDLSMKKKTINYQEYKLTELLKNSLGGNSMSLIICNINPAEINKTKKTLELTLPARVIENQPILNEISADPPQHIMNAEK